MPIPLFVKILLSALLFATPINKECINTDGTHIVSINCDGINCFRLISNCDFDTYTITVYNRMGLKVESFYSPDLANINQLMNGLKYDSTFTSGTYYACLKAARRQDTIVKQFVFALYK